MKTILKISILSNVILLGGLLLLWWHPRVVTTPAPATPAIAAKVEPQTPPVPVAQTVAAPFWWSQLSSSNDFRIFVANLRAAGCPEATVEDIIRGDTGRAYAMMRERLGVSALEPGRWSEPAQEQMVAYFLGQTPNAEDVADVSEGAVAGQNSETTDNAQTGTAGLAEFLQNTDFTTPGMTAEQTQETANLRQTLLAQISGASQMPGAQSGTSSRNGIDNTPSSPDQANNTAPSQISADNSPADTDNSQPAQAGTGKTHPSPQSSPLYLASQEESMMAGVFGIGAAIQYEQQSSQGGQQ